MRRILGVLFLALAVITPTFAQDSEADLKKELAEIKKELAEIKKLLQARPAPAAPSRPAAPNVKDVEFNLGDNPIKGDPSAALTLVEMTDYQCPFCSRYANQTYPQIEKEYVETGKIRYALLDLPLESIHRSAFKAAEATHCAEEQGKFWEMHDRLFANQRALEPWSGHAEAIGLDVAAFDACMESGKYAESIREDMATASKAGARGTPAFLIAKTDPDDPKKVTGLVSLRGAQPFPNFKAQLDRALSELEK
jgi:protein-disulfide isomerase